MICGCFLKIIKHKYGFTSGSTKKFPVTSKLTMRLYPINDSENFTELNSNTMCQKSFERLVLRYKVELFSQKKIKIIKLRDKFLFEKHTFSWISSASDLSEVKLSEVMLSIIDGSLFIIIG